MKGALIAFIALAAGQAEAARPACVTPHDMRTLIAVALPDAVEGLADRCKGALPPSAFLPSQGASLAARYRREAPVDPAKARRAIEAATGQDLSSLASDDTVTLLARQFVGDQIARHVRTGDCRTVDGMVALAAPLHADAMAEAILVALRVAGPGEVKGMEICPPKEEGLKG